MKVPICFLEPIFAESTEIDFFLKKSLYLSNAISFENIGNDFEAITEFKRGYFSEPAKNKPFFALLIAQSYERSENFEKAGQYYEKALENNFDELKINYYANVKLLSVKNNMGQLFNRDVESLFIKFRNQLNAAEKDWLKAQFIGFQISGKNFQAANFLTANSMLTEKYELQRKKIRWLLTNPPEKYSAVNAAYAVFPGGLFFRLGKISRGALSFLTVSVLGTLSGLGVHFDRPVLAAVAGLFAIRYYVASIIESYKELKSENLLLENKFQENLTEIINPDRRPFFGADVKFTVKFQ